jgi:hypothetical protein
VSYSLDVNILLYSSDTSSPFHARARDFLASCAKREEPLFLCYLTLMSFLRMSTHPRIFTNPLTPKEALENVNRLARLPHTRLSSEKEGYLDTYGEVTKERVVRANLVPDAHLASVLKQHGVSTLYTRNVDDFKMFDFLDVRNPLT